MKKNSRNILNALKRSHTSGSAKHASGGSHSAKTTRINLSGLFNNKRKKASHSVHVKSSALTFVKNHSRIVAGLTLVVALAILGIYSYISNPGQHSNDEFLFNKTYDWSNLYANDGLYSYEEHGEVKSRVGVDVSEHQHYIDWNTVAAEGIDFAFIRVGNRGTSEGRILQDEYFDYNIDAASRAGLDIGVYFFSQSINEDEAREEANFVLKKIKGKKISYPIVYDHEPISGVSSRADNLSVEQMTKNAQAFCEVINDAGYNAMIYGNSRDLSRYDLSQLSSWGIWLAHYGSSVPEWNNGFSIWQYSNSGQINGIDTAVDLDIHFLP